MKKITCYLVFLLSLTTLQAQELVVLECNSEDGKWVGNLEIDLKNKKLKYDNAFDKFSVERWNEFKKAYALKDNKEYEPMKYEVPSYEIKKITNSEIQAMPLTFFSMRGDLQINRYTLTIKEKYGEYKCQKKQKEF